MLGPVESGKGLQDYDLAIHTCLTHIFQVLPDALFGSTRKLVEMLYGCGICKVQVFHAEMQVIRIPDSVEH